MEFAFLDESGDPGAKGTNHLVLCLVCTRRKKDLVKVIVNVKKRMLDKNKTRKWLNSHGGEIKFHAFPDHNALQTMLRHLSTIDMWVYYISFNKQRKTVDKEHKKLILTQLLKHSIEKSDNQFPSKIVADMNFFNNRKVNRFIQIDFLEHKDGKKKKFDPIQYYFEDIDEEEYQLIKDDSTFKFISIEHLNSRISEELQAVDLIAGSIFQKLEHDNEKYYGILFNNKSKAKINGIELIRKVD
ncbi:MAG: DUF3800 domain-containing protein [Candidatus Thermoplasmatota archaeon]|nr:DUF3800 domain-containing protein [Candidatus Thermoplasmatota archaeon]